MSDDRYGAEFFSSIQADAARSASVIAPLLAQLFKPSSVVDIGCGTGDLCLAFAGLGVKRVLGIDGPWAETARLALGDSFRQIDLSQPFDLPESFDLAISLEVAEHLPAAAANGFVSSLARCASVVAFSAAIPHQGGTNHVNERWPEYWAGLFSRQGFSCYDWLRPRLWNDRAVCWWYAQNMLLFVRQDCDAALDVLRGEHVHPTDHPLALVHPQNFEQKLRFYANPANAGLRSLLKALPEAMTRAAGRQLWRGGRRRGQ
jgi:SAM-dependent methyltransferase